MNFINLIGENKVDRIGTFKVTEDTTTDLGRMLLTHANDAYVFSRSENHPSNKNLIASVFSHCGCLFFARIAFQSNISFSFGLLPALNAIEVRKVN